MKFDNTLTTGKLIKRYKRFLADVELPNGDVVTAHCANSGSMMGLKDEGLTVYLSPNTNPKAKLDWRWEMVDVGTSLVGINTSRPNHIVEEAILDGTIEELQGYPVLRREVERIEEALELTFAQWNCEDDEQDRVLLDDTERRGSRARFRADFL